MKPCAVCPDPILDEEEAHWVHEDGCPISGSCTCDLYVHPTCCTDPWCVDFEDRMRPDPFPVGTEDRTPVDEMLLAPVYPLPAGWRREPTPDPCWLGRALWCAVLAGGLTLGGGLVAGVIWWRNR